MEWKKCIYDDSVEISDEGQVRKFIEDIVMENGKTYHRGHKMLTPYMYGKYLHINFNNSTYLLHRLVAEHFLDKPENSEIIKFKDGDVLNVVSDNLEWCTRTGRMKEILSSENYRRSSGKSKKVYCTETDTVYDSIKIASENLKLIDERVNYDTLSRRLRKHEETEYLAFHIKLILK